MSLSFPSNNPPCFLSAPATLTAPSPQISCNPLQAYDIPLTGLGHEYIAKAQEQFDEIEKLIQSRASELQATKYKLLENIEKNRLACKVFSFDHNILNSNSVPFLNGSTITVPEFSAHPYFATQAPRDNTLGDMFVLMKEHNCRTLISLVMHREPKVLKQGDTIVQDTVERCVDFWSGEKDLGNGYTLSCDNAKTQTIDVDNSQSDPKQFIVIRTLTLQHMDGTKHEVEQIHYQNWPDHGTPNPLVFNALIDLANQRLQADRQNNSGPPVAHCHAGCGRTGIFIAVRLIQDYIESQLALNKELSEIRINIPELVFKMKLCREMIKNLNQYQFVLSWAKEYLSQKSSI